MTIRIVTFIVSCGIALCAQLGLNGISAASPRKKRLAEIMFSKPVGNISVGKLSVAGVFENENYDWQESRYPVGIPFNTAYSDAVVVEERRILEYAQENRDNKMYLYETVHKIIRINSRQAIGRFNKVHIPLTDVNRIIMVKARTIHPSGIITEVAAQSMRALENVENTGAYLLFALESIEPGSEIEYIYQVRREPSFFGRAIFEHNIPIWHLEFEIITPEHLIFEAKSYNRFPELRLLPLRYPGKNSLYARIQDMLPAAEFTSNNRAAMRVDYKLAYNTRENQEKPLYTWADIARIVRSTVYDFETVDAAEIKRLREKLAQIFHNADDEKEKINAIIRFVNENIRIEPHEQRLHESATAALDMHIGGKTDIVQLYALLFTIADIPHRLLVTADRSRADFDSDFVTPYALEEFVFHFTESDLYFSPVHPQYGLGMIPAVLQGNQALVVTPPFDEWEEPESEKIIDSLPVADFSRSVDQNCLFLQADEAMNNISARWERTLTGHFAALLLGWHRQVDREQFENLMHKVVQYHVPQAIVENIIWEETTLPENIQGMTVRAVLQADGLLEYAGETRLLRIGRIVETGIKNHSPEYPFGRHYQIHLQLPQEWRAVNIEELNKSAAFTCEQTIYALFRSSAVQQGNELIVNVEEYFPRVDIPQTSSELYQAVRRCAAEFAYVTLVIQKAQ